MRRARHKNPDNTFYHLITRVAGSKNFVPLQKPEACHKLLQLLYHYLAVYEATLVAFEVLGTHYHLILWMKKFRPLSPTELQHRARQLWGEKVTLRTAAWSHTAWERFNRKLFDLSSLMQHLNGEFAKWYNQTYGRRGHFWADRFQNLELLDLEALQACLVYIETNATRARLVKRPEQWKASSAWLRHQGQDSGLMPIEQIFPASTPDQTRITYRWRLAQQVEQDAAQPRRTNPSRRQRFFSAGIVLGSRENVARVLAQYRADGRYRRRQYPIPQRGGELYSLREQRSHART